MRSARCLRRCGCAAPHNRATCHSEDSALPFEEPAFLHRLTAVPSRCLYGVVVRLAVDTARAPGWRDVALHPPWLMDGLPENFPTPPPTSMRNLAAVGYSPRTADLDTSLRRWESTPAVRI